jgi:flagellar biosynthetic protein FliR
MFLADMFSHANLFFLILVRVFAMLAVAPLFSSEAIPGAARAGLAFFTAVVIFPWMEHAGYPIPDNGLAYIGLLIGEALLGILQGFFLVLVYAVFQMTGQFLAQQMGFNASETYDPLAEMELPVLGQFTNLIAMMVFLSVGGFPKIFLMNVWESFHAIRAVDFLTHQNLVSQSLIGGLGAMFERSFLLSLPVLGVLLLTTVTLGLIGKAAPQMNLMMMGFPISIGVGFSLLILGMPFLLSGFAAVVSNGFSQLNDLLMRLAPAGGRLAP